MGNGAHAGVGKHLDVLAVFFAQLLDVQAGVVTIAIDRAQYHVRASDQSLQAALPPTIMVCKNSFPVFDQTPVEFLDLAYSTYNQNTFSGKIEQWRCCGHRRWCPSMSLLDLAPVVAWFDTDSVH